jgi:type III secretory pathway component EscU
MDGSVCLYAILFEYALATMAVSFLNIPFCDVCIAVDVCNLIFCALQWRIRDFLKGGSIVLRANF